MDENKNMRFARIQRNRTVCVGEDASTQAYADQMLDASFEKIDWEQAALADLRICSGGTDLSQIDMDVPTLAPEADKDCCRAYVPEDAQALAQYLDFAVADENKRRALMRHTPFIGVIGANDAAVAHVLDILQTQDALTGVGVVYADADVLSDCSVITLWADAAAMADAACRAQCAAAKQAGICVAAILQAGITKRQVQSFCAQIDSFCDACDLWGTAQQLCRILQLEQADAQVFYEGALLRLYGIGRPRDLAQGIQLLTHAAQMRHVGALVCLADCIRYRVGCTYDAQACNRLLEEAARCLSDAVACTTPKQLRQTMRDAYALMQHFLLCDKPVRAGMLAVRSLEICDAYLEKEETPQAIAICRDHARRVWTFACRREDFTLMVQSFCRYARWCFSQADACAPAQTQWILAQLDSLTQQAVQQQDRALMRLCTETALMWQTFQTKHAETAQTRAALIGYLDVRGELDDMDGDLAAARDAFERCVALCRRQDDGQIETVCTLAKVLVRLGDVCSRQADAQAAYRAFAEAAACWQEALTRHSDAQTVIALCEAMQKHACSAVEAGVPDAAQIVDDALRRIEPITQESTSALVWQACANVYMARAKLLSPSRQSIADYQHAAKMWRDLYELTYEERFQEARKQSLRRAKADLQAITPPTRAQRWLHDMKAQAGRGMEGVRRQAEKMRDALENRRKSDPSDREQGHNG